MEDPLKEDFSVFWDYVSPKWAGKFLDRWCTRTMRSQIEPMKKVAKTLRKHKPLTLNWFKAKKAFSCGIVEGLNNKIKVAMRKSYGFRTYECTEIALYQITKGYKISDNDLDFDYIFIANRNGLKKLFNCIDSFLYKYENRFRILFEKFPFTLPGLFKEEKWNVDISKIDDMLKLPNIPE